MRMATKNGIKYLHYDELYNYNVEHGFSTRGGGESRGQYKSLNLSYTVGDCQASVEKNRYAFFKEMELAPENIIIPAQEHTTRVILAQEEMKGLGVYQQKNAIKGVDGMVTGLPGIVLSSFSADCLIVFFVDKKRKGIGICHAGWRGAVAGIAEITVEKMLTCLKADPAEIIAGFSPCIGSCCYEVGEEVADTIARYSKSPSCSYLRSKREKGKYYLDLRLLVKERLLVKGLKSSNILNNDYCTFCQDDLFYSHRRDKGRTGRMMGFISF